MNSEFYSTCLNVSGVVSILVGTADDRDLCSEQRSALIIKFHHASLQADFGWGGLWPQLLFLRIDLNAVRTGLPCQITR